MSQTLEYIILNYDITYTVCKTKAHERWCSFCPANYRVILSDKTKHFCFKSISQKEPHLFVSFRLNYGMFLCFVGYINTVSPLCFYAVPLLMQVPIYYHIYAA